MERRAVHKCQDATALDDARTFMGTGSVYVIDDATMVETVDGDFDAQPVAHPRSSIPGPLGSDPRMFHEGTLDTFSQQGPFSDAAELTTLLNAR